YASAAEGADERLLALHQQSLETNQILLLYQNNMFSSIGVYFMETSEGIFNTIDARITAPAATLRELLPDLEPTLQDLEKQYSFMQPRLINHHDHWVPTIATFYRLRNTKNLDQMARDQLRQSSAPLSNKKARSHHPTGLLWYRTTQSRSESKACMSNSRRSWAASQMAERTAPLAKVMRLEALWVISTRSPSVANSTV